VGISVTPGPSSYATVAYNARTGATLWAARYGVAGFSGATSVAVSPDSSTVFVIGAGASDTAGSPTQYATVAHSASAGAMLWVARFGPPAGYSSAASVAVSPDEAAVFVTGYSPPTAGRRQMIHLLLVRPWKQRKQTLKSQLSG
jgi:DNA-binding beta-propeller fold protein YncE